VPIYRWFNPSSGDHFYTTDKNGELGPPAYKSEGVEWYMYNTPKAGTTAVYRWFNGNNGDHFYTTDPTGELAVQSGYRAEGILGYLYPNEDTAPSGTVALFRWYQSGLMSKFTFSSGISTEDKAKLYERHSFAYYRAGLTEHLFPHEKDLVRALYRGIMHHDVDNTPKIFAKTTIGGRTIWVNFGLLFNAGDNEIAQSLLHEMMHCAGYNHPVKSGTPGDNGPYFGSAPLRAELAIAGFQSDVAEAAGEVTRQLCPVTDEEADRRIEAAAKGLSG
ncbi:hypothetical protein IMZ48_17760, partial [Candidatus Bathyarchaeota archaeon]|nr:hypothetical protein [Candidatus Bathyarchaeota archaeon]